MAHDDAALDSSTRKLESSSPSSVHDETIVPHSETAVQAAAADPPAETPKTFRFWMIIIAMAVTLLLTALEATVVSTALPTIAGDLDAGDLYVWFINSFFLTR